MNSFERTESYDEIAVIGISCRFPGAENKDKFWDNLKNGIASVSNYSMEELVDAGIPRKLLDSNDYIKKGYTIDHIESFDAGFFGYSEKEAALMDPQQRLFIEECYHAFEDAGYIPYKVKGNVGVFGAARMSTYMFGIEEHLKVVGSPYQLLALMGNDKDYLTSKVSYKLNLRGPSVTVQTACSSSLVAVHFACESLLSDESDMALAGGVAVSIPGKSGYMYKVWSM